MMRTYKFLLIFTLTFFGLWGCSKAPSTAENNPRVTRLEEELRFANNEREGYRQKLAETEAQLRQMKLDREEVAKKLREKTDEAKELLTQYDGFRKNLREMIGQADVAMAQQNKTISATPTSLLKP
jgi:septal ring factor EnvC (AmiA/AmiB activator)